MFAGVDPGSVNKSGIQAHVLDANDLLSLVHGDCVPDCYVVGGQAQFVGAGEWIARGERVRKGRDWLVEQMEDRPLDGPSQRLRQGLDLLPGVRGEADEAITH